jgi:hypothetical protein
MVPEPGVDGLFGRAWTLLRRNPILLVPGLVVGILAGFLTTLLSPPATVDPTTGIVLANSASQFIAVAIGVLAFLVTQTYTVGMAGAAWERGAARLADGAAAFRRDAGKLLGAMILVGIVAIVLAVVTLGIGEILFLFFALYAIPAVVLNDDGPVTALRRSFTIAARRFASTLVIVILIVVISFVVGLLSAPLAAIPFLGPVLAAIISQAVTCYATLVIAGEFLATRHAPDIER